MTLSLRIYRTTLLLYPADLRREFGDDMAAAFAEDLARAGRLARKLRVWCCCLTELFRIAIPAQKENPLIMVPIFAFLASIAWISGPLLIDLWRSRMGEGPFMHMRLSQIVSSILLGPVAVALVGFVVARFGKPNFTSLTLR
jgi:hypothetical protein